jgi:hypothetical protein
MPFEAATTVLRGDEYSTPEERFASAHAKVAERHAGKWLVLVAAAKFLRKRRGKAKGWAKSANLLSTVAHAVSSLPYWMQGDEELDTQEAWEARRKLRSDPQVLDALRLWWGAALRSVQSMEVGRASVGREDYFRLSRLLHKALLEAFDPADADACAAADWMTDAGGESEINQQRFEDCIFELAVSSTACP